MYTVVFGSYFGNLHISWVCKIQVRLLGDWTLKKSISLPNPWVCSALDAFPVVRFWAQCLSNVKKIETETWSSPLTSWICCRCSTTSQVLSINWLQICVGWSDAGAAGILWVGCPAALRCMGMPLRRIGGGGGPAGCFWWRHWMQETNKHQWETYKAIYPPEADDHCSRDTLYLVLRLS